MHKLQWVWDRSAAPEEVSGLQRARARQVLLRRGIQAPEDMRSILVCLFGVLGAEEYINPPEDMLRMLRVRTDFSGPLKPLRQ